MAADAAWKCGYSCHSDMGCVARLENVDAGLMNGAHDSPARVDSVARAPHHDGSCTSLQTTQSA